MVTYEELKQTADGKDNVKIEYFPSTQGNEELENQLHSQINTLCEEERFLLELKEEISDKNSLSQIDKDLDSINTKLLQLRGYLMVLTHKQVPVKAQYNAAHTALKGMLRNCEAALK